MSNGGFTAFAPSLSQWLLFRSRTTKNPSLVLPEMGFLGFASVQMNNDDPGPSPYGRRHHQTLRMPLLFMRAASIAKRRSRRQGNTRGIPLAFYSFATVPRRVTPPTNAPAPHSYSVALENSFFL